MRRLLKKTKKIAQLSLFFLLPNIVLAQTTIAPNLMIIFGNGFSMNRFLDDRSMDFNNHDHFNDEGDMVLKGVLTPKWGTLWVNKYYGEHPSSKMYIAKQALKTVLNDSSSDKVNFGLATFRQTFGMEVASATLFQKMATLSHIPNRRIFLQKQPLKSLLMLTTLIILIMLLGGSYQFAQRVHRVGVLHG